MSCWVVPMVAAEIWGVPVESVLAKAREGEVPSKTENGFMFVDVAPNSPRCDAPKSLRPVRPPTFSIVSDQEMEALAADVPFAGEDDELISPMPIEDYRVARQLTAQRRCPPAQRLRRNVA